MKTAKTILIISGNQSYPQSSNDKPKEENTSTKIYNAVLKGEKEEDIEGYIKQALDEGMKPFKIVDELLIPAINKVGELYDQRVFLPQLILSAEAMKTDLII